MRRPIAGYVSFGTSFYVPEKLKEISRKAETQLTDAGIELVATNPVFGEGVEVDRAIAELKAGNWDFLFLNVINWIDYRGVTRVIHEFRHRPMLLYSFGGFTDSDGTLVSPAAGAGSTSLRFPMQRWGICFRYLYNPPDSPMDLEGIGVFARAAMAATELQHARMGMIGFNDMGLYSTGYNVTTMRTKIGLEIESMDMLQLDRAMEAIPENVLRPEVQKLTAEWEYPNGKPAQPVIDRAVKMYLATRQICEAKNFSAISYKCVEGISLEMNAVHSVPSSLIATAGYPYVDENDMGSLAAELMLKYVSGEAVTFLEHYEHHPEWIILAVDGMIPDQMIEGKPQIKDISTVLLSGIANCSKMKTGRLTLASLSEDGDHYRMHIVTGTGRDAPQWVEMGVELPPWPGVQFYPDGSVRDILDHVQSQHFAAVFGDYADELICLCEILGIDAVVDR